MNLIDIEEASINSAIWYKQKIAHRLNNLDITDATIGWEHQQISICKKRSW